MVGFLCDYWQRDGNAGCVIVCVSLSGAFGHGISGPAGDAAYRGVSGQMKVE
jgi:hypothetical protein